MNENELTAKNKWMMLSEWTEWNGCCGLRSVGFYIPKRWYLAVISILEYSTDFHASNYSLNFNDIAIP